MQLQLPRHDDGPADADDILLGEPRLSIGTLYSCTTEVTRRGRRRNSDFARLLRGRISFSAFAGMVGAVLSSEFMGGNWMPVGVGLGLLVVQPLFRPPAAATTFVGSEGLARYTQTRTTPGEEVLRWDDAEVLLTSEMRRSVGLKYLRTLFQHTWFGPGRRDLFKVQGAYHDGDGGRCPPQPYNLIHFAKAAEKSFTAHLLARARGALARGEEIAFEISNTEGLWLSSGRLILQSHPTDRVEVPNHTLTEIERRGGILILHCCRPAKTLLGRSNDEHRFRISEVPNFGLLMALLEEHVPTARFTDRS